MKRKVLNNKKIIVAVTGSVAAYKSIELIRELRKAGAEARVIMTPSAERFVTPYSIEIASGNPVQSDMFSHPFTHIELPQWGDAMVVAPATANSISKFSTASASDMVSCCFLAFQGPVIVAPAMNWRMYSDRIFQERLGYVREKGVIEVPPERGSLACGEEGMGRMAAVDSIVAETMRAVSEKDFSGKKMVVTAGPTREKLDPVRFLSNRSSGKMGYAVARNAYARGAEVLLISGPSSLEPPYGVRTEYVESAGEMFEAVKKGLNNADVLIMAAAVADYAPKQYSDHKLEKKAEWKIDLCATVDILEGMGSSGKGPCIVGFAAETGNRKDRAREKLSAKDLDLIVFNDVSAEGCGFDVDTNAITLIEKDGEESFPLMTKDEAAEKILNKVRDMLA